MRVAAVTLNEARSVMRTVARLMFVSCYFLTACGERGGAASQEQSRPDGSVLDAATTADGANPDSGPRACSGVAATYDIGALDLADLICRSPDYCTVCVQTVDQAGNAVQWFAIPLAHCVCPSPTVRLQREGGIGDAGDGG